MNDLEWDYPNPYTIELTVAEDDIDGLNHANNAVYVKWYKIAGWAHSYHLGLDIEAYRELDRSMAIQKLNMNISGHFV